MLNLRTESREGGVPTLTSPAAVSIFIALR